ncbi:MAG: hemolysin III family protein [Victivallales bacterium]|nr:hemolysin III family protein [Victivallales bacterium]MCF7888592.1 hemolysin III family protein [Victivallales bacterium]
MFSASLSLEEKVNSITHGLGALLGIIGGIYFVFVGLNLRCAPVQLLCLLIFIVSLILLYSFSAFYHLAEPGSKRKIIFQKLDHSAIFLLIAGTYTPFMVFAVPSTFGVIILTVNWMLAGIGIIIEIFDLVKSRKPALILYLTMGWLTVFLIKTIFSSISAAAFALLFGGGIFYTCGVYFYLQKQKTFFHAVWHVFVLLGSLCHYFSILIIFLSINSG